MQRIAEMSYGRGKTAPSNNLILKKRTKRCMPAHHQMHFVIGLLIELASATLDISCNTEMAQGNNNRSNDLAPLPNTLAGYNVGSPCKPQIEAAENDSATSTLKLDIRTQQYHAERLENTRSLVDSVPTAPGQSAHASPDRQERGHCTRKRAAIKVPPSNSITSKAFRAQMAKRVRSLKNTLPSSHTALNETYALMNSRVILPSAETVHWFSTKMSTDKDYHEPLASLHLRSAHAYHRVPEHSREAKETNLFEIFLPYVDHATLPLTSNELETLALHRRHIGLLANHILHFSTDEAAEQITGNGQCCLQPLTFDYRDFDPHEQLRLCTCFAVQLLTSGFFSHIPATFMPLLQNISATKGALLVNYMLSPDCVDLFPEFITALYIIMSDTCTDAECPWLLNQHRAVVTLLPATMGLLYKEERANQHLHLKQLVADYYPALCALGARELTDEGSALQTDTGKAAVYWHALSALAMFDAPVPNHGCTAMEQASLGAVSSSVTEHIPVAEYLVRHFASPVANTASLSCWVAVLIALMYSMPTIDVYAFMVAHTPPAFAGPLLRYGVVHPTAYTIIVSLWLAFEMPHTDSILENLDAIYTNPKFRYKAHVLARLPVRLFRRAPPELLRKICCALFKQERACIEERRGNASLKRQASGHQEDMHSAGKRSRGGLRDDINGAAANEDVQILSSERPENEAQAAVAPAKVRKNQKGLARKQRIPRIPDLPDDCGWSFGMEAPGKDGRIALSRLAMNLYIHCRLPDDITNEEVAYLVNGYGSLYHIMTLCCKIDNEVPQIESLSSSGYLNPSLTWVRRELLETFGDLSRPGIPGRASASGSASGIGKHSRGRAVRHRVFGGAARGIDEPGRRVLDGPSDTSRASQGSEHGTYDVSWDMYANCRHCVKALPAFFARQILPPLVDVIYAQQYLSNGVKLLKLVEYILDADGLASSMRLLEKALGDIAIALQWTHPESPEPAHKEAGPDMPQFALKSNPAMRLTLKDMEVLVQRRVSSNFLDARAYMEISDALYRLIFRIIGARNFTLANLTSNSVVRRIFVQIMDLLPRECPFVYQASGSAEQAQIECTWSPVFRSAPSRASPTAISSERIENAIKNLCYCCIHALSNDTQVEEWLSLLTWLFTRPIVQSHIASPKSFLPNRSQKRQKACASVVFACIDVIKSLITRIAEDKANVATNLDCSDSLAKKLARANNNRSDLCNSLQTKLIQLLSLINVSGKSLSKHLANLSKKEKPRYAARS